MARPPQITDEEALRLIEAVAGVEDDAAGLTPDPRTIARMRAAVDQAFERAWDRVRALDQREIERAAVNRRTGWLWSRDGALARLAELRALLGPQLQLAHRKLDEMADDDVRTLVIDLEVIATRTGKLS
jgi:hypothetical protein